MGKDFKIKTGHERRALVRIEESIDCAIRSTDGNLKGASDAKGIIVNMSPGGLGLTVNPDNKTFWDHLTEGTEFAIDFTLPLDLESIQGLVVVAWILPEKGEFGIRFKEITTDDSVKIAKYIELKCVKEGYELDNGLLVKSKASEYDIVRDLLLVWAKIIDHDAVATLMVQKDKVDIIIQPKNNVSEKFVDNMVQNMVKALNNLRHEPVDENLINVSYMNRTQDNDSKAVDDISTFFNVPLIIQNEAVGMLNISTADRHIISREEVKMIYALANQAANNIQRLRGMKTAEENKIMAMLGSMAEGVILFDQNKDIVLSNPVVRSIFDVQTNDELTAKIKEHKLIDHLYELNTNPGGVAEQNLRLDDAKKSDWHIVYSFVTGEDRESLGYVAVLRDVTKEREADRIKSEFISTVSHELRTPLAIIKEGIALVLDNIVGNITDDQRKILSTSKSNVDRLARIVNDLLDISKIESGEMELHCEPVNLADIAGKVVNEFQNQAKEKNVQLICENGNGNYTIYADGDKMTQVFTNLVSNAVKFVNENGEIKVRLKENDAAIEAEVQDNGIGIDSTDLQHVFDKFRQFGRKDGPGIKGTGLGTSICKQIVEMHGGTIWVESALGEGATFYFSLPKEIKS